MSDADLFDGNASHATQLPFDLRGLLVRVAVLKQTVGSRRQKAELRARMNRWREGWREEVGGERRLTLKREGRLGMLFSERGVTLPPPSAWATRKSL